jgi:hypothetical protein
VDEAAGFFQERIFRLLLQVDEKFRECETQPVHEFFDRSQFRHVRGVLSYVLDYVQRKSIQPAFFGELIQREPPCCAMHA